MFLPKLKTFGESVGPRMDPDDREEGETEALIHLTKMGHLK